MPNRPNPQQEPESECCQETHHHHLEYLKNRMPTQQEMDDAAELFKVFGDPTRLKLLAALLAQEMCVCDLSDLLGISQSAVSLLTAKSSFIKADSNLRMKILTFTAVRTAKAASSPSAAAAQDQPSGQKTVGRASRSTIRWTTTM